MEIELVEIRDFIAQQHPFDLLTIDQLNAMTQKLEMRYLRRGKTFPPTLSNTPCLYIVRTGAVEMRDANNELMGKLGEGDIYTTQCQLIDFDKSSGHITLEDSLIYQLPCNELKALFIENNEFRNHFEANLTQRLQQAAKFNNHPADMGVASMTVEIGELIKKQPIVLDVSSSIQQAAQLMSEHNVSSIMITEHDKLAGIVTDRDLRRRCVAKALDVSLPVTEIMSSKITTMSSNDLVLHALLCMTKKNINHLPVVDGIDIKGMLTASDLTRHISANPAFMSSKIRKATSLEELQKIVHRLPEIQLLLSTSGVTARHIGETISRITDVLTTRLIEMAQDDLGPEPVPFVWVSGGSQARYEQSSHSDQDNALIISDELNEKDRPYFTELAKKVCDGLNSCGFVYCPGDAMAMNEKWCQPYSVWEKYFKEWIFTPDPTALMLSSIFFDLRPVYGDFTLHRKLINTILQQTSANTLFIAHMVSNALKHKPPVGFFRTFVLIRDGEHDNTFDIKHRGIVPITDIARVLALAEGINKINTSERIEALGNTRSMSKSMSINLLDALEFIANLRIKHQAQQIRNSEAPDNFMPPDDLSSLERKHLKDAFSIIKQAQESLEKRYSMP